MFKSKKHTKKLSFLIIAMLFGAGVLVFEKKASAEDVCDLLSGKEKEQCEDKMDEAEKLKKIINLKEKQSATISSQLQVIDLAQQKTGQELRSASDKLKDLNDQIAGLTDKIKENERQISFQRKMLQALMQNYYEYDRQGILNLVLLKKNLSETLRGSDYIRQSGIKVNELLAEIKKIKTETEEQKNQLEAKKSESEELKEKLEDQNLNLQNSETQKEILLGQTQKEKEKYSRLLADIENEIYELEAGKSVDFSRLPAAKGGYFNYPVSRSSISQGYGCLKDAFARRSYPSCSNGKGGFHNGLDFNRNSGTTIFSARSGKVIGSGNNGRYAYGQWLAIDHGDGLVTLYGHLSSKSTSKGKSVKAGEKIGIMGTTGYSTGTHLHFSVFDKKSFETVESRYVSGLMIPTGGSIDPRRYLK